MMIKESIQQEDITVLSIRELNNKPYLKLHETWTYKLKTRVDNSTIVGKFNILLSIMDRNTKQIVNRLFEQH